MDPTEIQEDGSSPKALWQAAGGFLAGFVSQPLVTYVIIKIIVLKITYGGPVPFWLWVSGFLVMLLIETALGLWLRRFSQMCAITFAIAAFFSILTSVAMMTDLAPLLLPK
jgi:hypothetical protein